MASENREKLLEKLSHAAVPRKHVLTWKVQVIPPLDQFPACTLTIGQWLANDESNGYFRSELDKWEALIAACSLVHGRVEFEVTESDGLREPPRVGYAPAQDQPIFIFKMSNNGTTILVSPRGVVGVETVGG